MLYPVPRVPKFMCIGFQGKNQVTQKVGIGLKGLAAGRRCQRLLDQPQKNTQKAVILHTFGGGGDPDDGA